MKKGKLGLKTIISLGISILVIVLLVLGISVVRNYMSGAAADYEPQNLVAVPKEDGKSAMVTWTTDKSVKASILYGTNIGSLLLMAEDIEPTTSHSILLTNLRTNTNYFYKVVVDNDNVFDNGGSMYSFKTGSITEEDQNISPTSESEEAPLISEITPTVGVSQTATGSTKNNSTCQKTVDYNKDGVVNSMDYLLCVKGKVAPSAIGPCDGDYNNDGVINSLDKLKCLQDTKR